MAIESSLNREKINTAGEDILAEVKKMYDALNEVKNLIDGSKNFFDSPSGDKLRKQFNASAEKFGEFKEFLNTYGEFLKTFSGNVKSFEEAVENAIGGIPTL